MPLSVTGSLVLHDKIIKGTITVENGKISNIQERPNTDKEGIYILPGLIEVHGHLREPGMTQKEDIPHGTKAALAGGYTTIIDMPNTNPPTTTVERLKEKIEKLYPNRSYTDYAFFMGVGKDTLNELENVDQNSIVGIKVFMAGHETTPTTIPDDETLGKIMEIAAKRNMIVAVHAEDQDLINEFEKRFRHSGEERSDNSRIDSGQARMTRPIRTDPALWSEIRPKAVVIKAVQRALMLAKKNNTKVYLLHLSTQEEFALVKAAKESGMQAFGELVGYQLFFTIDDYAKYGNKIKVAPALRTKEDQDKVWKLLRNGTVDVLCSEHTPHEWETKNQPDMWKAQAGTPGLQETLPVFLTKWVEKYGKNSIEQGLITIAKTASQHPAEIFGFTTKGELSIGKDADFSVINTTTTWTVKKEDLFSKCGWSAYEEMTLIGRPIETYLRGEKVYENGTILGNPQGKWLKQQ